MMFHLTVAKTRLDILINKQLYKLKKKKPKQIQKNLNTKIIK